MNLALQSSLLDSMPMVGVRWEGITRMDANAALIAWGHKMGEMRRVDYGDEACHGLIHDGKIVAITCTSGLVREAVGGFSIGTRETAIELSRLCACRPDANRAALRLWRMFTFPLFKKQWAISYQDANLHTGATYKNDGWDRVAYSSGASSVDQRTGRQGRDKWVWVWPCPFPNYDPVEQNPSPAVDGGVR